MHRFGHRRIVRLACRAQRVQLIQQLGRSLGMKFPPRLHLLPRRAKTARHLIRGLGARFCRGGSRQQLLGLRAERRKGGALSREQPTEPLSLRVQRAPVGFAVGHRLPQTAHLAVRLAQPAPSVGLAGLQLRHPRTQLRRLDRNTRVGLRRVWLQLHRQAARDLGQLGARRLGRVRCRAPLRLSVLEPVGEVLDVSLQPQKSLLGRLVWPLGCLVAQRVELVLQPSAPVIQEVHLVVERVHHLVPHIVGRRKRGARGGGERGGGRSQCGCRCGGHRCSCLVLHRLQLVQEQFHLRLGGIGGTVSGCRYARVCHGGRNWREGLHVLLLRQRRLVAMRQDGTALRKALLKERLHLS
mmetsp:Transcript_25637/g.80969  ORF Transcript_25637/g.80969 Transcript_25637/m.80969 type:complete len:354 (+) Transcript_25637:1682-2743(+)